MTTLALDDHPMNWGMGVLIMVVTGLAVLSLDAYAMFKEMRHAERETLTLSAFSVSLVWVMLAIFALGDSR